MPGLESSSPRQLKDWIDYIQTIHNREIDLSLQRVKQVINRLCPNGIDFKVVSIAGTNGKGSTAELIASIYHAAGYLTGKYTSPHLMVFNERIIVNRDMQSDETIIGSLQRVEDARQNTPLTFFEFTTLAAIDCFNRAGVDVAVMEVGLGGRLDAVNCLACDVAVITSISIDHTQWLGDTIEQIAHEKLGIARPNTPCVIGLRKPHKSMLEYCQDQHIPVLLRDRDFNLQWPPHKTTWSWQSGQTSLPNLPLPFAAYSVDENAQTIQLDNAATALAAIYAMQPKLAVNAQQIRHGIEQAYLLARGQIVSASPWLILDVAHNQASINNLAQLVRDLSIKGRVYAVCGMLQDKKIADCLNSMLELVDEWHLATIHNDRGSTATDIDAILKKEVLDLYKKQHGYNADLNAKPNHLSSYCHHDAISAYTKVINKISKEDALIVFGSFYIVGDIMPAIESDD